MPAGQIRNFDVSTARAVRSYQTESSIMYSKFAVDLKYVRFGNLEVNPSACRARLRYALFAQGLVPRPSVLVKFHSPDGSGCRFVHSAASGVVLKLNGYYS